LVTTKYYRNLLRNFIYFIINKQLNIICKFPPEPGQLLSFQIHIYYFNTELVTGTGKKSQEVASSNHIYSVDKDFLYLSSS